jgi:histone H3/H4
MTRTFLSFPKPLAVSLLISFNANNQSTNALFLLANDDLSLPKATVQKIVSEILPPSQGIAFNKDARDLLIECCVEFITLISSEANEISEKESKKTIACEHITKALEQLGFGDYVPGIMEVASEHKETLKVSSPFLRNSGANFGFMD